MANNFRKKLFLLVFCLSSITQGMYSTYFVSILTTIERIYQIQSKTAGGILSATEIGQILGSLFISYYGGRGNKPRWISLCMTISALAALISISPHFLLVNHYNINDPTPNHKADADVAFAQNNSNASSPYLNSDLSARSVSPFNKTSLVKFKLDLPNYEQLCRTLNSTITTPSSLDNKSSNSQRSAHTHTSAGVYPKRLPVGIIITLFFTCLLAIGFGSTAITTLGIPFMDDIISKEESPLYLGLTIGLRIFGPALGFLLGSFCIQIDSDSILSGLATDKGVTHNDHHSEIVNAWWLGLVIISLPLLVFAIPMYCLSRTITSGNKEKGDYEDITYQAAEDHDIGGSHDFPAHMMRLSGHMDVTSNRTSLSSEVDTSSSQEVLKAYHSSYGPYSPYDNYNRNIAFNQPIFSSETLLDNKAKLNFTSDDVESQPDVDRPPSTERTDNDFPGQNVCLVVNHFGGLESTSLTSDAGALTFKDCPQISSCRLPPPSSSRSSVASTIQSYSNKDHCIKQAQSQQQDILAIANLSSSLSRLLRNRLLVLRMLSSILHILPIAGFYTFLPKYLIEQFRITSSSASAISGLAGILFVGFGAFTGGTIIRLFNVNSRIMTRWIATSALLYTIGMLILMNLSCEHNQIVHLNSDGFQSSDCSSTCSCSSQIYSPVCANGTTYISPCLAGCRAYTITEDRIIYDECGCSLANVTDKSQHQNSSISNPHVNLNVATQGQCLVSCDNLLWYVILFSAFTLVHASCEVGSMMFNLRCVRSDERTLALGLITFTSSLLGTIPCSIIYGAIVDYTCVHWDWISGLGDAAQLSRDPVRGACRAYENDQFRYYLHGLTAFVMFLAFLVDVIISTRANEVDFYEGKDDSKADIRMGLKKSTETI